MPDLLCDPNERMAQESRAETRTSCDCSESFDIVKVDFNQIALAVFSAVQSQLLVSIGMWAYDRRKDHTAHKHSTKKSHT